MRELKVANFNRGRQKGVSVTTQNSGVSKACEHEGKSGALTLPLLEIPVVQRFQRNEGKNYQRENAEGDQRSDLNSQ